MTVLVQSFNIDVHHQEDQNLNIKTCISINMFLNIYLIFLLISEISQQPSKEVDLMLSSISLLSCPLLSSPVLYSPLLISALSYVTVDLISDTCTNSVPSVFTVKQLQVLRTYLLLFNSFLYTLQFCKGVAY